MVFQAEGPVAGVDEETAGAFVFEILRSAEGGVDDAGIFLGT